jgi:hypothetical protein
MQQKQVCHLLGQRVGDRCDVVRAFAQAGAYPERPLLRLCQRRA